MSRGDVDQLLRIWAARELENGGSNPPFSSIDELLAVVDSVEYGEAPWHAFTVRYSGDINEHTADWKKHDYIIYTRDSRTVLQNMLSSADFKDSFDYQPFEEFTAPGQRRWCNLMSGTWAWQQAVYSYVVHRV